MKKLSIMALIMAAACQPASQSAAPIIFSAPASDDAETLDFTKLADGFPVIAEMGLSTAPKGCALSKANRFDAKDGENYDQRYVFTAQSGGLYQLGINGTLRTLKPSEAADMETTKVRYFKTIDGPEVEIQVSLETAEDGSEKGIVGRVKAWDAGVPLMCGYNRVEVVGDCDL